MSTATVAAGDATKASGAAPLMTHRQILLVIYALMAGMFLSSLDQTIVGTAIRTIGDDLHGLDQQAWVTTAYLITSTIATPIYGKLSDIFGRRPLYIFGLGVFILGSILSTFSTSMIELAAFRGFQGIGAGALMSIPLAIMGDMLAPRERAKYQGYFLSVFAVSSVVGPLVGGLFADSKEILWVTGWRWVFLINVPIGIGALIMVLAFLHLPKVGEHRKVRIDWWGATAVIVTLVPLLLVAEQGREWGWTSGGAILCYVLGAVGLISFLIIESRMGTDAIIPLRLFRSRTFSMATVLGFLVGFGMFGAMLTLPLYLQLVTGLTPTESGFATLPMVAGLMVSSIVSGQIIAKVGKYRIFPILGTLFTLLGYVMLTFMTVDQPLWFLMICMFMIGLGLGQMMQSLTLATQNAVQPQDMGVATSSSTFFRQIGGTMGTAILLSVLFGVMPNNISAAMGDKTDLTGALNAALNPAVASAPANAGVMDQLWNPIVNPIKENVQKGLDEGTTAAKAAADAAVTKAVTEQVNAQVAAGRIPAAAAPDIISQQVAAARPDAEAKALSAAAEKANASVVDGKLAIDYSNEAQRSAIVDKVVPGIVDEINNNKGGSGSSASTSDTSFLNGADKALTRPFMKGFNTSAVSIYWVGLGVMLVAFILSWFFKVPPLRQRSALQEQADQAAAKAADATDGVEAAAEDGVSVKADSDAAVVSVTESSDDASGTETKAASGRSTES